MESRPLHILLSSRADKLIHSWVLETEYSIYSLIPSLFFLVAIAAAGMLVSRRVKDKNARDYFLGSRSLGSVGLGGSLFVTGAGSMWLLGTVSSALWPNSLGIWYGIFTILFILILGYYFAPIYLKSKVITVPRFVSFRFNTSTALWFSGFSILFYIGVKIPLQLILANWMIEHVLGWSVAPSAGLLLVVILIGLYTVAGGFDSVLRTQIIQAAVVLVGSIAIAVWVVVDPSVVPRAVDFSLFGKGEYVWLPYMLGLPIVLAWHWFADQVAVQRILAARDSKSARRGTMLGAALVFAFVVSLLVAAHYATPLAPAGSSDPGSMIWFKGLGSVVFLALLMAGLTGDFHSAATLFTMDFYRAAYPDSREESLVLVGRLSTTMIIILAILGVSTVSLVAPQLIALLQQFQMHVAPPIVGVFLLGMFWKRTSNRGALWGLMVGEFIGAVALAVRFFSSTDSLNDGLFGVLASLNPFAFGFISLVISSLILVGVSLLTEAPSSETNIYMSILKRKVS